MDDIKSVDPLSGGFNDLIGLQIQTWRSGYAQLSLTMNDQLRNRSGTIHGGVLATMLDAAGGFAGCYCSVPGNVRKAVTLSLTTQFVGQVSDGIVYVEASRIGGGRKVFFIEAKVTDAENQIIATAQGAYRYRSGSESEEGQPFKA